MKPIRLFSLLVLTLAQSTAFSQDWEWELTPYLSAAGIDGTVTTGSESADISVGFKEILNVLCGVALLRVETHNGNNRLFGDLVYKALEEDEAKDTVGRTLGLEIDSLILEAGYSRSVSDTFAWDFGVRYWDMETTLIPTLLPTAKSSSDWTDGFAGPRFSVSISDNWTWITRANIGAGGSDLPLGLNLDFRRKFGNGNSLAVGFRALSVDFDDPSAAIPMAVDTSFMGLTVGYVFDV